METNQKKSNNSFDPAAMNLLEGLKKIDPGMADFLARNFEKKEIDPAVEEKTYNYFLDTSVIITSMAANHGTSIFTEFLYSSLPGNPSIVDNYVLQSLAGKAVKARLEAIETNLSKMIADRLEQKGSVVIGNFGSGPGRDVIDIFAKSFAGKNVRAVHVDKDTAALNRGRVMAKSRGIDGQIEFMPGSFMKYAPKEKFDIILLVGILCPLEESTCVSVLEAMGPMLAPGGSLIASNATKIMEAGDRFSYYIMNWMADWKLVFKDEPTMKEIFNQAGFAWQGSIADSYGFHLMGMGSPK